MKTLKYLSPTSIDKYVDSPITFYMIYLADKRPDREPQTNAMAVGSSFDAYCKSYLHEALFGKGNPKFEFNTIFESQVEKHNRDEARKAGQHIFDQYKRAGCLADKMIELKQSVGEPRFEFDVEGFVAGQSSVEGFIGKIPFLGKPDVSFVHKEGARVVDDWKVNGYYSKSGKSPMKGYIRIRDIHGGYPGYKGVIPGKFKGIRINMSDTLDALDRKWAAQLAIYSWLLGEPVGSQEFVAGIDQIVCRPGATQWPMLRFAEHRLRISAKFQYELYNLAAKIWTDSNDGWFFKDMSKIDSQLKCERLDNVATTLAEPIKDNDDWLKRMEMRN